jgi:ABC-2 type transport system ATP-binding protein
MIQARGLTKRFGDVLAVDNLTFDVEPGRVTCFLGPNGSGKSTTMAMIMGLDHPSAGTITIAGKKYHDLKWPLREVGALLEARAIHPGRSARTHLLSLAQYNGLAKERVEVVLDRVGLSDVANKRVGKFSLGMSQRLGIAAEHRVSDLEVAAGRDVADDRGNLLAVGKVGVEDDDVVAQRRRDLVVGAE